VVFNRLRADYVGRPRREPEEHWSPPTICSWVAGRLLLSLTRVTPRRPPGYGPGAATLRRRTQRRTPAHFHRDATLARGDSSYLHPRGDGGLRFASSSTSWRGQDPTSADATSYKIVQLAPSALRTIGISHDCNHDW